MSTAKSLKTVFTPVTLLKNKLIFFSYLFEERYYIVSRISGGMQVRPSIISQTPLTDQKNGTHLLSIN